MQLTLNVYTDENLTELKRTCEADKLKIPYRVAMYLLQSLDSVSIENDEDLVKFISGNVDKLDKIIKATFGITETELDCVDAAELIGTLKSLYVWVIDKTNGIGDNSKNVKVPVSR